MGENDVDLRAFGRLEAQVEHVKHALNNLSQKQEAFAAQIKKEQDKLDEKLDALHELLAQAKGARRLVAAVVAGVPMLGGLAAWASGIFRGH